MMAGKSATSRSSAVQTNASFPYLNFVHTSELMSLDTGVDVVESMLFSRIPTNVRKESIDQNYHQWKSEFLGYYTFSTVNILSLRISL